MMHSYRTRRHFAILTLTIQLMSVVLVDGYVSKCLSGGFKCASCEELIHCVETPADGFKSNLMVRCNTTRREFCSVEKGGCVNDETVCHIFGQERIHCEAAGAFPDPHDCNSFHMCRKENDMWVSTKHSCPEDRAFDALTATCRFKTTHRVCQENPVDKCRTALQNGAIPENPNIYYVCVPGNEYDGQLSSQLQPRFYKCKPGHVYSKHTCLENVPTSANEFVCKDAGNFVDSSNCYRYFECDENLKSTLKTCRPGTYFNAEEATCVKGTC